MKNYDENFFEEVDTILNTTIEGIILIKDGFIVNVNNAFINILNYDSKEELIGFLAAGCLMPYSKEKFIKYNQLMFQEISLLSKDGICIPAIIQIKDIKIKKESFKMVSILDLSELKRKESLLLKQSRLAAMGEMISMIAHQWRQPLAAIASATTHLKLKIAKQDINLDFFNSKIEEINSYIQYTSHTVDDFRDFFKNDKSKQYFKLNELVNISVKLLLPSLEDVGIKVIVKDKDLTKLYLYENELIQVILNIINNSKDAFLEKKTLKPQINILFDENEKEQSISIIDNAGGIPQNIISKIFDPYFSTKDNLNGSGIGLYMSKIIVEKHSNGKISASNTQDGCCFKIVINKK